MKRFALLILGPWLVAAAPDARSIDTRIGALEKQIKVIQRQVFPKGAPIEPEIAPQPANVAPGVATEPEASGRISALEREVAQLTQQLEQTGARLRQTENTLSALEARVARLEGSAPPTPKDQGASAQPNAEPAAPAASTNPEGGDRAARVAAVAVPNTGDAMEDAYSYAFRLYDAGLYPEAQTRLKAFIAKYPKTSRTSYARNLLGRAYLDEGKPALASVSFYDNYKTDPEGARAPESLYWLGRALTKLGKLPDACNAYDELQSVYAARLSADLKARMATGRSEARCRP